MCTVRILYIYVQKSVLRRRVEWREEIRMNAEFHILEDFFFFFNQGPISHSKICPLICCPNSLISLVSTSSKATSMD